MKLEVSMTLNGKVTVLSSREYQDDYVLWAAIEQAKVDSVAEFNGMMNNAGQP